ncbi:unnamed protein product [Peniophora sp. CBMAI 1063]|nr:unnamed protein product [Peniophora sp. CBMAI 1063]
MSFTLDFSTPSIDALVDNHQRCYVRPAVRADPDHPDMLYLEYGPKAQNYQDPTAFWRDWEGLQLPNDVYSAASMDWERKHSLDSDQHPFLPRRQSIYAQTPNVNRVAPEPDVPLGDYVRSSRDDICIAPWLVMGPPSAPRPASKEVKPPTQTAAAASTLKKCLVDFSQFTFTPSSASRHHEDDDSSPPPSSPSSSSSTGSGRSECSTPMTTPERDFKPLPRRSTSPPDAGTTSHHRKAYRAVSPTFTDSDSGDEYEDDDYVRAPKRKAKSATRKAAPKRRRAPVPVAAPSPSPNSSDVVHPPLPTQPNARGRWPCPYNDCLHETGAFGDLQRHLESLAHTPEKRHRCGTCHTTFTREDALKRHVQKRPERCRMIARGLIKLKVE